MEAMTTSEAPSSSQADHDRLAILERLAMTPSERVRANAAMYRVWVQGQQNRRRAIAARVTEPTADVAGS